MSKALIIFLICVLPFFLFFMVASCMMCSEGEAAMGCLDDSCAALESSGGSFGSFYDDMAGSSGS